MGMLAGIFGGGKKDKTPAPKIAEDPVTNKQEDPTGGAPGENVRRKQASQRSQLVSGRSGSTTRGGVNIPGSN